MVTLSYIHFIFSGISFTGLIDCSKSQVALVLLRSKHWDLDPKYFLFEDVVGFGFKSLTFLPISNVTQNQVHFLVCCSHSHRTLLETEYRGDCKRISWKNFWSWHMLKDLRGKIRWQGCHLYINPFLPCTFWRPRKNSLLPRFLIQKATHIKTTSTIEDMLFDCLVVTEHDIIS